MLNKAIVSTSKLPIFYILILILGFTNSCTEESPVDPEPPVEKGPRLELVSSFNLQVYEPSGLCFSLDKKSLWTVSDDTRKVYKLDLNGTILKTLSYTGNDLEGVAVNPADSTIWVAEEYLSQIVQLDTLGNELNRITVPGAAGGKGLEGITVNYTNGHYFMLKEQDPGVLIELDEEFNLLKFQRKTFAYDFSGIFYESQNHHLWIVSDQNETVFKCDMNGAVIFEYPIDVRKAEGIAVDIDNNLVYVVSDDTEQLFIFEIIEDTK